MCDSDIEYDMIDLDELEEKKEEESKDTRDQEEEEEEKEEPTQLRPDVTTNVSTCNNKSERATVTLRYVTTQDPCLAESIKSVAKFIATECNNMLSVLEECMSAIARLSSFEGIDHAFLDTLVNFRNVLSILIGMIKKLCGNDGVKAYALLSSHGNRSDFCVNYQSTYYGASKCIYQKKQYSALEVSVSTNDAAQILDMATKLVDNAHHFSELIGRFPIECLEDDCSKTKLMYKKQISESAIQHLREHVETLDVYCTMKDNEM